MSLTLNGRDAQIGQIDAKGACSVEGDMMVAPSELPLKTAIDVRRQTNYPIAIVDQLGRLAGLCDHTEIYKGLLQKT